MNRLSLLTSQLSLVTVTAFLLLVLAFIPVASAAEKVMTPQDVTAYVEQHKGKVVIINYWASWCGPCRTEFPELKKLREAIPESKLVMLGISLDFDSDMYLNFSRKQGFPYPVRLASATYMDEQNISAIPKTLLYDTNGKLVQNHDGPVGYLELLAIVKPLLPTK